MRGARPQSPWGADKGIGLIQGSASDGSHSKCILEPTASCFRPTSALFIAAFCRWVNVTPECARSSALRAQAALHLTRLQGGYLLEFILGDVEPREDVLVEYTHTPWRDGPNGQLRLPRRSKLARDDYVEGCTQRPGNLVPHYHTPTRQGQDNRLLVPVA